MSLGDFLVMRDLLYGVDGNVALAFGVPFEGVKGRFAWCEVLMN